MRSSADDDAEARMQEWVVRRLARLVDNLQHANKGAESVAARRWRRL
jgi:hypothetical protein